MKGVRICKLQFIRAALTHAQTDILILSEEAQIKQEKFEQFMDLIGLSERTILNYLEAIRTCSMIVSYSLAKKGYESIYDIIDPDEIRYIQQLLDMMSFLMQSKTKFKRKVTIFVLAYKIFGLCPLLL